MPLLEVVQTRYVSASIRLTDTTALQLDQYAAFIHASADEVIDQALAYVFSKDRDFQEFLRTPEAQRITPTLRVRRAVANDAVEPSAKKPVSAASSAANAPAIVAGSKA
jgi:Flp pilus assembly protein TadD